jgi:hypothetical protein
LVTNENELSVSEGSLRQATNVNVDEKGVLTFRRGFNDYGGPTTGSETTTDYTKQIFEYKDRIFRHFSTSLEFEDNTGAFNAISGVYQEVLDGYRIKWQESNGNMYFTTSDGVKKISLKNNSGLTSGASVSVENAGIPKASYIEAAKVDNASGFLPAQSKCGYRFIFGRKDVNGNLLLGSPSARYVLSNDNTATDTKEEFTVTVSGAVANGDYVHIPTANFKTTFYFDTNGSATSPIDATTIGSTFIKVDVQGVVGNANIAAVLANEIINTLTEYDTTVASNVVTCVSTEQGDITDASVNGTNLAYAKTTDGNYVDGTPANANVTVIVPSYLTEDYFIQVYRTAYITATSGLTLEDIDPGDESNLVYEIGLTSADITAGELTFEDTTPESFRSAAAPLYTNEVTGEGILQANDQPPIALDLELFRNSMFYANTKQSHRLEFTILSVDDFVNDSTVIVIGNSTASRYYTAAAAELQDTTDGGDFKLSTAVSVAQAIDETARSLVKIINQDNNGLVNAFYLSGADDLPGQILLESKNLTDDTFYIAVQEDTFVGNFGEEFSPTLPVFDEITSLTGQTTTTRVELTGHGYSDGDSVYVSFNDSPAFSGVYTITYVDANNFDIPVANTAGAIPITNATAVFSPDVESDNLEAENRLYYSKSDEPEAVPFTNFINVGAKDEPIRRILALRDNLFVLKDDGVFLVSGSSAPNFTVRQTDNTRIIAPDSAVVLNNQIYCLTDQGIAKINGSGQVGIISRGIEDLIDDVANAAFEFSPNTFGISYENDRAYVLFMPQTSDDTSSTQAYRFNIFERTWTRWEYNATCGHVLGRDNKLYLGNGDRNYVSQERKNFDRTDFSDRDFTTIIPSGSVAGTIVELGDITDVEVADVITQTQEVTINYLNSRLLRRMDEFDTGITPPASSTMVDSFSASDGDNIVLKLQALNDYLVTLDAANITAKVFTSSNFRTETDTLVDELNAAATITTVKTYAKPETITYEAYISKVDVVRNQITIHQARPFLAGTVSIYKHINKVVEWNPQHFGDPSALKQIREVSIIFDQNNFYDAKARFGSDVAQDLIDVNFQGKGIGYWGDMDWGNPNHYWGGEGNDIPFRTVVPRGKQRCRYLTLVFEHKNAREEARILGISGVVRAISSRAYK